MIDQLILLVLFGIFLVLCYAELFRGSALDRKINKHRLARARVREARKRSQA
jgi:hypothetical protein